jgi:hypothetical protein
MKLPLQQFWFVLYCWTSQVPVLQAEVLTGLSEKAIRKWYGEFRNHLPLDHTILRRLIQLDEAYFGGKNGRALMMGREIGTRKLAYHVFPHTDMIKQDAAWFLETFIEPKSQLNTDGAGIYRGIQHWFPVEHRYDVHKKFEFGLTSQIEGVFGVLKTFIRRMYHHVTCDKLDAYVSEFCFRFSHPEIFSNPRQYLTITLSVATTG